MYGQYGYAQNMPKFNAQGSFIGRQEVIEVIKNRGGIEEWQIQCYQC